MRQEGTHKQHIGDNTMYAEIRGTKKIGKGAFTTAYRKGNTVYAVSRDSSKECIALFCKGKHIPKIERLKYNEYSLYKMPFYKKCTKKDTPESWEQYKQIRKMLDKWSELTRMLALSGITKVLQQDVSKFNTFVHSHKTIKLSLRKAIVQMVENYFNYVDAVYLEISPRNIAVNSRGTLVLLDIMYDKELL